MKALKIILLIVVIIIAVPLIIALFVKKEYTVAREITITKPASEVYDYVKYLKKQDLYSKWVMQDPAMKKEFRGTDGTEGFIYAWNSNKDAGEGEQEITHLEKDRLVTSQIRFKRPMASTAYTHFTTEPLSPTQTKVVWQMEGKSPYPLNFMNLFMNGLLGKDMDESLSLLKNNLEKS